MRHIEDGEAKALWGWAQHIPILRDHLYHVPNGGKRGRVEAARMKGMGVRPGVSDYHLPIPRGAFHGLWLELKAPGNNPTPLQDEWLSRMVRAGYAGYVVYGCEEAIAILQWYLGLNVPTHTILQPPKEAILIGDEG